MQESLLTIYSHLTFQTLQQDEGPYSATIKIILVFLMMLEKQ